MRAVILAALMASPAAAQENCATHDAVTAFLAENFGESRQVIALDGANRVLEFYASTATGSWSLLITTPDGRTCLVADGTAFERTDAEPAPQGEQM